MVSGASRMHDSSLLDAFAKQKGMCTIDDADLEPKRLSLQQHHELSVAVEYCVAARPSKLGSLRGSSEKYESMYDSLEMALDELRGGGGISLRKASPSEVNAAANSASRGALPPVTPVRPKSAAARLGSSVKPEDATPRIGSFEVLFTLVNCHTGHTYGPMQVHSKLQTRQWPLMQKLRQRIDMHLQHFLIKDIGHHQYHQEKERVSVALAEQRQQVQQEQLRGGVREEKDAEQGPPSPEPQPVGEEAGHAHEVGQEAAQGPEAKTVREETGQADGAGHEVGQPAKTQPEGEETGQEPGQAQEEGQGIGQEEAGQPVEGRGEGKAQEVMADLVEAQNALSVAAVPESNITSSSEVEVASVEPEEEESRTGGLAPVQSHDSASPLEPVAAPPAEPEGEELVGEHD